KTFAVAKDANVLIDGQPGKLAEVPVGAHVTLTLTVDRQLARQVHAQGPSNVCDCGGSLVKAVDVPARAITFDEKARAEVAGKTFTVAADAFITINGNRTGTLAEVPVGCYVNLGLRVDGKTVGRLDAQGPSNLCECGGSVVKAVDAGSGTITFDDKAPAEIAG